MARLCSVCGKAGLTGHSRSHSNIATKRKRQVNLQTVRIGGLRVRACTNCVRTEMKKFRDAASAA
ncbi:MAG: 50S ribosomal protein L28 [Candidatus Kerfeldbacteria bacterium]|nr:50S ribosomal protein L28 [Candidatus Kerfeldbacteria bacterium]